MAASETSTGNPAFDRHGSFTDKFMYKYLSAFLASMHPPPSASTSAAAASTAPWSAADLVTNATSFPTYYDEYENGDVVDFDYANSLDNPASLLTISPGGLDSFVAQSSFESTTAALVNGFDLEFSENKTFGDWLDLNLRQNETTAGYEYPLPLPHTVAIILAGTLLSILTAGGNLMVIMSFKLEKQLQTISNYFLFSLAVADLTIGLISIPFMTIYTAEGQWTLGYTTCQFWLSIDYLMCNASVMNLLLISFDRYFSVTRPLTYRPRRTSKKAVVMIAATFLTSLVLWPPLIIAWPHIEGAIEGKGGPRYAIYPDECMVQFLRTNLYVTLFTATVAFYGPVIIMIVLYSRVYYVTRTRQRELVKLQAFHQQSVRRSDDRAVNQEPPPKRATSTSVASTIVRKASNYSKSGVDTPLPGEGVDSDLITTFRNTCNNHSFRSTNERSPGAKLHTALQKIETEAKPWGIQALLDHFAKSKQLQASTPRKASLASSGFEEDESFSLASGDNTTSEAYPLRSAQKISGVGGGQRAAEHRTVSPSPSDYGSTLANQFVNHVRQSFMVKKRGNASDRSSRHLSLVPAKQRSTKRAQSGDPSAHKESRKRAKNVGSSCDPANSPIQELRKISAVAKMAGARSAAGSSRSVSRQHSTPKAYATAISEQPKQELDPNAGGSSAFAAAASSGSTPAAQTPSAYTVLIELGKEPSETPSTSEIVHQEQSADTSSAAAHVSHHQGHRGSCRGRPIITLHENASLDHTYLSPDRAVAAPNADDPNPTISVSVPIKSAVRRLSSCSSAVSEVTSVAGPPASPLIIANRGFCLDNETMSPVAGLSSRLAVSMGGIASRLSSIKGLNAQQNEVAGIAGGNAAKVRNSYQRRKRGERKQQESKAARTLSAILLAFIVTWTPYNLIVCIESFHPNEQYVSPTWYTFAYYLCYLNSTINPLLYALCNATFRRTFWRIMTCKWTPVKPSHRPSSHHHAAAAIAAVAVAAANRRQSFATVTTLR